MKTASVAEVKAQLDSFLKASESGPILVTRKGKPVAVLMSVHEADEIERLMIAYSPRLQAILAESRKQIREGEVLSHEEFWKEVEAARSSSRSGRKRKTGSKL